MDEDEDENDVNNGAYKDESLKNWRRDKKMRSIKGPLLPSRNE